MNNIENMSLEQLETEYSKVKKILGSKIAEYRVFANFPKRTYPNAMKSANLLFKTESGENLPNEDTLRYFIDLYQVSDKSAKVLFDLHKYGKQVKSKIIKIKRGWN